MSNNIITARYTFIASTHKTLTKRDYILSHKKILYSLRNMKELKSYKVYPRIIMKLNEKLVTERVFLNAWKLAYYYIIHGLNNLRRNEKIS